MSGKTGIRTDVDNLTERIARLAPAERWSLLMRLSAGNPLIVSAEVSRIERSRPQADIHINSWTIEGLEETAA